MGISEFSPCLSNSTLAFINAGKDIDLSDLDITQEQKSTPGAFFEEQRRQQGAAAHDVEDKEPNDEAKTTIKRRNQ